MLRIGLKNNYWAVLKAKTLKTRTYDDINTIDIKICSILLAFNITCDFESNNWCGYSEFTRFGRRQGNFFYLPYADHTTQTLEGNKRFIVL